MLARRGRRSLSMPPRWPLGCACPAPSPTGRFCARCARAGARPWPCPTPSCWPLRSSSPPKKACSPRRRAPPPWLAWSGWCSRAGCGPASGWCCSTPAAASNTWRCNVDVLPQAVQDLAAAALAEMQADPQHRLSPQRRQSLYAVLAGAAEPALRAAPSWLAVLAAQRVLPLFQARCPEDELPPALLSAAIDVLERRVDEAAAAELEARGYWASKNAWGYEADGLPWPVGLAADAALRALKEARGHRPLADLNALLRRGTVELQPDPANAQPAPAPAAAGDNLNDEDLCQMDGGDTASLAAVAAASSEFGPTCDPQRLLVFWTWWLQEALPAAVAAARRGQIA